MPSYAGDANFEWPKAMRLRLVIEFEVTAVIVEEIHS